MKEKRGTLEHNGITYPMAFNFNVMEEIQDEFGTLGEWDALATGANGEVNAKALKFGTTAMINEGIDIENEESNEKRPHLTTKQVGRLLYEIGLERVAETMDDLVNASTEIEDNEKNA